MSKNVRLFDAWRNMIRRCNNETYVAYPKYGGRGISVCDDWLTFKGFESWALSNGYTDELTLERKHNDLNYDPSNCTWATDQEQTRNRSNSKWWVVHGTVFETLQEASESFDVTKKSIQHWCEGQTSRGKVYQPKPNCYSKLKYLNGTKQDKPNETI